MQDSTSPLLAPGTRQDGCHWIQREANLQDPSLVRTGSQRLGQGVVSDGAWKEEGRGSASRPIPIPNPPLPRYLAKLSSVGSISEEETCEKLKGLIQRQVQMCKRNLEVMDSVRRGAQLAIEECQYQFRNRRWNCSTLDSLPVFGKVVTQGEGGARGGAGDPGRGHCFLGWGIMCSRVA